MEIREFVYAARSFARMGDAIGQQAEDVLWNGEAASEQNPNALQYIREWLAADGANYFSPEELEEAYEELTPEPEDEDDEDEACEHAHRITRRAADGVYTECEDCGRIVASSGSFTGEPAPEDARCTCAGVGYGRHLSWCAVFSPEAREQEAAR